jgi:hypothetical protein
MAIGARPLSTQLFHWFFCFALLTSSFDLALVVNLGGTVRASQVALLIVCFGEMVTMQQKLRFISPIGFTALVGWAFIQTLFVSFSPLLIKAVVYNPWLWFNIYSFGVCRSALLSQSIYSLSHQVLYRKLPIGLLGLHQFVASLLGPPAYLVSNFGFQRLRESMDFHTSHPILAPTCGWVG